MGVDGEDGGALCHAPQAIGTLVAMKRAVSSGRMVVGAALTFAALAVLGACDYGDGKTLDAPTAPLPTTTLPSDNYELTEPESVDSAPIDADSDTVPVELAFELITPWAAGGEIDRRHTCDSIGVSPALTWTAPPPGTAELAVLMTEVVDTDRVDGDDADNDDAGDDADGALDGLPPVHWVVVGIDSQRTSIPEGGLAPGAIMLANSAGDTAWDPPCPAEGSTAVYRFSMYALAEPLGDLASLQGLPLESVVDLIRFGSMSTAIAEGSVTR